MASLVNLALQVLPELVQEAMLAEFLALLLFCRRPDSDPADQLSEPVRAAQATAVACVDVAPFALAEQLLNWDFLSAFPTPKTPTETPGTTPKVSGIRREEGAKHLECAGSKAPHIGNEVPKGLD